MQKKLSIIFMIGNYKSAADFVRNWSYENIIPAAVKFNFINDDYEIII
jgi:hypothetical protein